MPGSLAEVPCSFWALAELQGRESRALGLHSGMRGAGKCPKACFSHTEPVPSTATTNAGEGWPFDFQGFPHG